MDKPVEIGRLNVRIAQRGDGVGALVIREKEEDIWTFVCAKCRRVDQQCGDNGCNRFQRFDPFETSR